MSTQRPTITVDGMHEKRRDIFPLACLLICYSVFLQKIALPGSANALPITVVLTPITVILGWLSGVLVLNYAAFIILSLFSCVAALSFIINSSVETVSFPGFVLVLFIQATFSFKAQPFSEGGERSIKFYADLMFVLSCLGIVQFVSQYIIGADKSFFIDYNLPKSIIIQNYNNLNAMGYGSTVYKSNGIFFAEPSFFSQFLSVAFIIELVGRQRWLRMLCYLAAMITCYSGTGLIVIMIFGGLLFFKSGNGALLLGAIVLVVLVIALGSFLQIDYITNRAFEFTIPNTSGHARFVAIFSLLKDYAFDNTFSALLGHGSGSIKYYYSRVPFELAEPTWGKLLFEYGIVASLIYLSMLTLAIPRANNPLKLPSLMIYFFMGGYLVDSSIISMVLVMAVYCAGGVNDVQLVSKLRSTINTSG